MHSSNIAFTFGMSLKLSPEGDCSDGPHESLEGWDVSRVTDMSSIFMGAASFNTNISKWDVSSVKSENMGRVGAGNVVVAVLR